MLQAATGFRGAMSAPHHAAAMAGRDVMTAGGTAIEAMVAAAATIAVVYPHMNTVGGDGFWLIHRPGTAPIGIFAGGHAAHLATPDWYAQQGHEDAIPTRGGLAALTVPGTIGGWEEALSLVAPDRALPLSQLLAAATHHAEHGFAVTGNQFACTADKLDGLKDVPGFADTYLQDGAVPTRGSRMTNPALGQTFRSLAENGLRSYYEGPIAKTHSAYLEQHGSPLRESDFAAYKAQQVRPLTVQTSQGLLYNMTPPTQGISSLMILGMFDRLGVAAGEGFDHIHGLVEATKQAFILRNSELGDTQSMRTVADRWLGTSELDRLAGHIDMTRALPWPYEPKQGDTIWMGATDADGTTVSFIQSVFWEFGSGLTCPDTGVCFQNRGAGFSIAPGPNQLAPGKRPFHTLNPALALLSDGRTMAYGTMGGEGQPQTQAAVFTRYANFGMGLQEAVTAPRWLLGKTWGAGTTSLKLEDRFDPALVSALEQAGHQIDMIQPFSDLAGHAGAVVRHSAGLIEAASDPRADGAALAD
ncbi:gamma-glutamyltransferase [Meridianimarinicoccus aquatilis]|uniref:Gamma-glutamyltransferase n=2 Tax=Meridianimarinicoccus aquatilis TaxID=2552766 RepID=A0A4R6ATN5_9RHOB|nr:gamma-glutamyltransferase [Fluviibacterium aquatile]